MIGLGSATAPAFDTRELPLELAAAGYEANGADTDYAATGWDRSSPLARYRTTAEERFESFCTPFNELEAQGPFDVRIFSRLPEHLTRGGLACIIGGLTLRGALRVVNAEKSGGCTYGIVYYMNTTRRVRVPA